MMDDLVVNILDWAKERDLDKGDSAHQIVKLMEEVGELAQGYNKKDRAKQIDSLGDTLVVLIILGMQLDIPVKDALQEAYDTIHHRKGKMVDGIFVKQADLN